MKPRLVIKPGVAALVASMLTLIAGCSSPGSGSAPEQRAAGVLRLGFTLDAADAPALVGLQMGYFGTDLGRLAVVPEPFTSISAELTALEHGQLDAAYIDPVAAVTAWQSAPGGLIRVIAGAASGGAELVVGRRIHRARQLARAPLAAPAGGAQQAALDYWLHQNGVAASGAGRITMTSTFLVKALRAGRIAGAWEPAPADAQMVAAGGHVLMNEAALWPGGRFATAVLVVTKRYLSVHPAAVAMLLRGHIKANSLLATARGAAETAVRDRVTTMQGSSGVPLPLLAQSFAQLTFTNDPLAQSMLTEARHAATVGLLKPLPSSLAGMYDLRPLNTLLRAAGEQTVPG